MISLTIAGSHAIFARAASVSGSGKLAPMPGIRLAFVRAMSSCELFYTWPQQPEYKMIVCGLDSLHEAFRCFFPSKARLCVDRTPGGDQAIEKLYFRVLNRPFQQVSRDEYFGTQMKVEVGNCLRRSTRATSRSVSSE